MASLYWQGQKACDTAIRTAINQILDNVRQLVVVTEYKDYISGTPVYHASLKIAKPEIEAISREEQEAYIMTKEAHIRQLRNSDFLKRMYKILNKGCL